MRFTVAGNRGQAACAVVGCVFLFAALGMLVYGRFCTSIGMAGLYNRASPGIGFILFGVAMACFTPCLYLQRMHRAHIDAAQLGSELKGIVLGFLCYGVAFIFAMGALSSADETGVVGIALAIAFGAVAVCYRRYRKKNPIAYKHTGSAALVAFCGAMAAFSVVAGASCGRFACGGRSYRVGAPGLSAFSCARCSSTILPMAESVAMIPMAPCTAIHGVLPSADWWRSN